MRPQFRVRISSDDVGERVSVRFRIDRDGDGPGHSDAVGWLRSWEDGVLRITRRDGEDVTVAEDRLVAGRVVGPPPKRRGPPDDSQSR